MNKLNDGQIQQAVVAGLKLLSDPKVRVPITSSASGELSLLSVMLQGLANKEIRLVDAHHPDVSTLKKA